MDAMVVWTSVSFMERYEDEEDEEEDDSEGGALLADDGRMATTTRRNLALLGETSSFLTCSRMLFAMMRRSVLPTLPWVSYFCFRISQSRLEPSVMCWLSRRFRPRR